MENGFAIYKNLSFFVSIMDSTVFVHYNEWAYEAVLCAVVPAIAGTTTMKKLFTIIRNKFVKSLKHP